MSESWGYGKDDGPSTWASKFPAAGGVQQSPIDIDTHQAKFDTGLKERPLVIRYKTEPSLELANTGASIKAACTQESTLTGGPLGKDVYRLAQFHLHWGSKDDRGAEHTIDGKVYSAESVQFILFEEVLEFSKQQMEKLRSIHFGDINSPCMVDNFRPTCTLGGRTVQSSFAH